MRWLAAIFRSLLSIPRAFTRHISGIEVIAVWILAGLLHFGSLSLAIGSPFEGVMISNWPTVVAFLRFDRLVSCRTDHGSEKLIRLRHWPVVEYEPAGRRWSDAGSRAR
jgi:hypothetical protein